MFNMFEKVNPSHPDKIADRIAGAIVDKAYEQEENPRIAVEVLLGHGEANIIAETSTSIDNYAVTEIVERIAKPERPLIVRYKEVPQDLHLAINQKDEPACGDNGIFKGVPATVHEDQLAVVSMFLWRSFDHTDGKYIIDEDGNLFICQSNANENDVRKALSEGLLVQRSKIKKVNPLGYWTGGIDVDSGATNRKLGSDMGRAVTGGGLHGKDLSKADVTLNIACHIYAYQWSEEVTAKCAIGDKEITLTGAHNKLTCSYSDLVDLARDYIKERGGFERFAEEGLIYAM